MIVVFIFRPMNCIYVYLNKKVSNLSYTWTCTYTTYKNPPRLVFGQNIRGVKSRNLQKIRNSRIINLQVLGTNLTEKTLNIHALS